MFGQINVLLSAHFYGLFLYTAVKPDRVSFFFSHCRIFYSLSFSLGKKKKKEDPNYFLDVEQRCPQAYNLILIFVLFPLLFGDSQGCLNIYSLLLVAFLL